MSTNEPLHDPVDLLDELDAITREQELLRQRVVALRAKYRSLESFADAGGFDKFGRYEFVPEEFGRVNVDAVSTRLEYTADALRAPDKWLRSARECAVKVREYPRESRESGREDAAGGVDERGVESAGAWSGMASVLADHWSGTESESGWSR
ncbi:hypothetical protein [Nocardia arizonensis]|uniref:hypothetical protein n=1 Tax=Nocardia arizonensis TaxID=1141647 RepID=UPI0006D1942A|nr:hypothetical protein [Nocardia arizonensis]